MDEQRTSQPESDQDVDANAAAGDTAPEARPKTMFDVDGDDQRALDEMTRFARKRAAIWGLAAGGIMSLILVVCVVLIYLLGTR